MIIIIILKNDNNKIRVLCCVVLCCVFYKYKLCDEDFVSLFMKVSLTRSFILT